MFRSFIKQSHIFKRSFSVCKDYGLDKIGIVNPSSINYNLSQEQLFTHEVKNNEGTVFNTKYGETPIIKNLANNIPS